MQKIDMKNLAAALPLLNKRAVAEKVMEALMEDQDFMRNSCKADFWTDLRKVLLGASDVFAAVDVLFDFARKYKTGKLEKVKEWKDNVPQWKALQVELLAVLDEWRDKCLTEAKGVSDAG